MLQSLAPRSGKGGGAGAEASRRRATSTPTTPKKLEGDAQAKEAKTDIEERRALRFDIGEGLLELGLVLCSLYFLARNVFFPVFGVLSAIAGIALGIPGWLL